MSSDSNIADYKGLFFPIIPGQALSCIDTNNHPIHESCVSSGKVRGVPRIGVCGGADFRKIRLRGWGSLKTHQFCPICKLLCGHFGEFSLFSYFSSFSRFLHGGGTPPLHTPLGRVPTPKGISIIFFLAKRVLKRGNTTG